MQLLYLSVYGADGFAGERDSRGLGHYYMPGEEQSHNVAVTVWSFFGQYVTTCSRVVSLVGGCDATGATMALRPVST